MKVLALTAISIISCLKLFRGKFAKRLTFTLNSFLQNFLEISYKVLTNFLQMSHKFLTNVSQMSHKCLTNVSQMSHKCLTNVSQMS